jgi:GNAT superfamily N-acetyltransferase
VVRFYRLPSDPHTAEVALLVQDNEQKKGVGTCLLKHLAILAWERGINSFRGEVLRENSRLLSMCRKSDPEMNVFVESGSTCAVTLSVAKTMSRIP